jgi:hypothetical protein
LGFGLRERKEMEKIETGPVRVADIDSIYHESPIAYGRDPHFGLALAGGIAAIAIVGLTVIAWMVAF